MAARWRARGCTRGWRRLRRCGRVGGRGCLPGTGSTEGAERVQAERVRRIGAIRISASAIHDPDPFRVALALAAGIRGRGLNVLPWGREATQLRERMHFLHRLDYSDPGHHAPPLTGAAAGPGHHRPRELLEGCLLRGAEGSAWALSQARVAGGPHERAPDEEDTPPGVTGADRRRRGVACSAQFVVGSRRIRRRRPSILRERWSTSARSLVASATRSSIASPTSGRRISRPR